MPASSDKHNRTEAPTPKRKKRARRKGQVAHSPDVTSWFVLVIAAFVLPVAFKSARSRLESLWAEVISFCGHPSIPAAMATLASGLSDVLVVLVPTLGLLVAAALIASAAQTGLLFAVAKLKPDPSKINPISGIKRMFSANGLWQVGRSALKLALVGTLAVEFIVHLARTIAFVRPVALGVVIAYAGTALLGLLREVSVAGFVLAGLDYLVQRHQLKKSLMMTKQEVRDEMRQDMGDPQVRAAVRKKQYRMTRLRMLAQVAKADLVVTNPTHFAVALSYQADRGGAPKILAKGMGDVADRVKKEAMLHFVPIVEDPPVARALYGACEVGDEIPKELYLVVARLLAFVYTLPANVRAHGAVHRRRVSAMVA